MAEVQKLGTVKELGEFYLVGAPLYEQLVAFNAVNAHMVSVEDAARARLAGVSDSWTRTSVASVAIRGENLMLYRPSPLMNLAVALAAVKAHRKGFYLERPRVYDTIRAIAKAEETMEPEDRTALVVSQEGDFELTPDHKVSRFLFRQVRQRYFAEKTDGTILFCGLSTNSERGVVNHVRFDDPQDGSDLYCDDLTLDLDFDALGVCRTGEVSAKKGLIAKLISKIGI
ncbi:MAG: hypothetical protein AABX12_00460 [Nanoarchaeota archaeon]